VEESGVDGENLGIVQPIDALVSAVRRRSCPCRQATINSPLLVFIPLMTQATSEIFFESTSA